MRKSQANNVLKFRSNKTKVETSQMKGFSLFQEGMFFFNNDNDSVAFEKFLQAEKEGYKSADLFANLACLCKIFEEVDKALVYAKKALRLDNKYGYAHALCGKLYIQKENPERGMKHLLKAIECGYTSPFVYGCISDLYDDEPFNNYLKAQRYAVKATSEFPEDYNSFVSAGYLFYRHQDFSKALEYFLTASKKMTVADSSLAFSISYCYSMLGNLQKAIEYANQVIFLNKNDWNGYYRKGFAYFQSGEKDEVAKSAFLLAEKYGCPEADMYTRLAYLSVMSDSPSFEDAVRYSKKALELSKKEFAAHFTMGLAYHCIKEDSKTAIKYFRKYKKLSNDVHDAEFYYVFGEALLECCRFKFAEELLQEAVKIYPKDENLQMLLIEALLDCKKFNEADKYIKRLGGSDLANDWKNFFKVFYNYQKIPHDYKACLKYGKTVVDRYPEAVLFIMMVSAFKLKDYELTFRYLEQYIYKTDVKNISKRNYKSIVHFYKLFSKKFPEYALLSVWQERFKPVFEGVLK